MLEFCTASLQILRQEYVSLVEVILQIVPGLQNQDNSKATINLAKQSKSRPERKGHICVMRLLPRVCKLCLDQEENYIQAGLRQLLRSHSLTTCGLYCSISTDANSVVQDPNVFVKSDMSRFVWNFLANAISAGTSMTQKGQLPLVQPFSQACHLRALASIFVGGNDVAEQLISYRRLEY